MVGRHDGANVALRVGQQPDTARTGIRCCNARPIRRRHHARFLGEAEQNGTLTRVNLGLWAYPNESDSTQIPLLSSLYQCNPQSHLQINQIKIYSDGEVGHTTAALKDPYAGPIHLADPHGLNDFGQSRLTPYITSLEAVGFDFHIHTIGDRDVHEALNSIEPARNTNGLMDRRHRRTHVEVIDPADVPRFVSLDVTADFQTSSDFVLPSQLPWYKIFLGHTRFQERVLRFCEV